MMNLLERMKGQYLNVARVYVGQFSLWALVFAAVLILSSVRNEQAQTLDTAFNPNAQIGGVVRSIATQSQSRCESPSIVDVHGDLPRFAPTSTPRHRCRDARKATRATRGR